jgi:hypothetical protein
MGRACLLAVVVALGCASQPPLPPLAPAGAPVSAAAPVVVYGATWCRHTRNALDWLAARGVPARFRNVESDPAAYDDMNTRMTDGNIRGGGIPVLDVRGRVLLGFHADEVERALRD